MHPNPAYRTAPAETNLAFARERGFGILSVNGPAGPLAAHVPFVLDPAGLCAEVHLVRSNPVVRALEMPRPALLAVSGPDGYVSPDWYGLDHQVPTWNYIAVHLRGRLERLPDAALRRHLDVLSDTFESRLLPKTPWKTSKLPADIMDRFMRMIVPCRLTVEDVQGTWKLGQNKPAEARRRAADGMADAPQGQDAAGLADRMRGAAD